MSSILAHAAFAHLELALFSVPALVVITAIVRELRRGAGTNKETP